TSVLKDDSIVGELFSSLEDERRLRVLGGFTQGSRHVYTDRGPIESLDDLAGLKIRVQESDVFMELTRALGGSRPRWRTARSTQHCRPGCSTAPRTTRSAT